MSGNNSDHADKKGIIWIVLSILASLNLLFFLHAVVILKPIWNEMRNFIVGVIGIKIAWMDLIYWETLVFVILFAVCAAVLVRARPVNRAVRLHIIIKIIIVAALILWNALLAMLFVNTGSLFLAPQFRYEWDILGPWVWLLLAALFAGIFVYSILKMKAPAAGNKNARIALCSLSGLLAVVFIAEAVRSVGLRLGPQSSCSVARKEPVDFVNPLVGTRGGFEYGKTLPLVAVPFGMTHWTPATRESTLGVHPYKYLYNSRINGFIGTHKPAVWMGDYGQVALMPGIGAVRCTREERGLYFAHSDECSTPYSYSVKMRPGWGKAIGAEMTATERCGYLRFTFPAGKAPYIVVEASREVLPHGVAGDGSAKTDHVFPGYAGIDMAAGEITGYNTDRDSDTISPPLPNFKGYFVIKFSRPIRKAGTWENEEIYPDRKEQTGDVAGAYAVFDGAGGEIIEAKIGTSFISLEQARENLAREIPGWDFARVKEDARSLWRKKLGAISIEGASEEQKEVFYTAMYRCLLFPRIFSEYGRYYSAFDDRVHNGISYNDYSLWDTFRALHPLLIFIAPERVPGMITALLQMYDEGGWMPKWPNPGYTNIMIGTHADSVIADAYIKGVRGFDVQKAYRAVYKDAMQPPDGDENKTWADRAPWTSYEARGGLTWYKKLGFIPSDKVVESVSCTLEYAYDDFCVAQLAKALGKESDYRYFMERSRYYKNVYNKDTGFMAPRRPDGSWDGDPLKGFTEGGPWTYLFCAMQDVPGLMELMGGREAFLKKLDANFDGGHYVHENEPGHHYVYLYDYAGEPWKTQERAREYCNSKYGPGSEGLAGDEDCGQMSAWYIFSAMGFYPVVPGSTGYAVGSPLFPKVVLHFDPARPDRKFEIIAKNVSDKNKYVQSAVINGRPLLGPFIRHEDIVNGTSLVFVMGDKPNYNWK